MIINYGKARDEDMYESIHVCVGNIQKLQPVKVLLEEYKNSQVDICRIV